MFLGYNKSRTNAGLAVLVTPPIPRIFNLKQRSNILNRSYVKNTESQTKSCTKCGIAFVHTSPQASSSYCRLCVNAMNRVCRLKRMVTVTCKDCHIQFEKDKKILPQWKGRCQVCQCRETVKNRRSYKKEHHPNWKGGVTEINHLIRTSAQYHEWRLKVYKRDNYRCQICKNKAKQIAADHYPIPFVKLMRDLETSVGYDNAHKFAPLWDISNGRTLCRDCHIQHGWNRSHPLPD